MQNKYEDIVLKTTAYIGSKAGSPISVTDIARNTGYARRQVERAFRRILNQSICQVLQARRLRIAKELLQQTQLGISAIAFESGFGDYANFARAFRAKVGLSPTKFREEALLLGQQPDSKASGEAPERCEEWFKDSFPGMDPGKYWKPVLGRWKNEEGSLFGAAGSPMVLLQRPLPENCRIRFELLLSPSTSFPFPNFRATLFGQSQRTAYCYFMIATGDMEAGEFGQRGNYGYGNNANARIEPKEWHVITAEIQEDRVAFFIDHREVFRFRDSFPPPYANRCYLGLGGWHSNVRIRKFSVQNLGFRPVVNPIRQGDSLYNAGLAESAQSFYMRYLESGSAGDAETMELRYKIGMCCLSLRQYSPAQTWIEKVIALKEEKFWAEQARLALLELGWRAADFKALQEHIRLCVRDPETRDRARVLVRHAMQDFDQRGYFEQAILAGRSWSRLEPPGTFAGDTALLSLSDCLVQANRFGEAEEILLQVRASRSREHGFFARLNLMQLYNEWGKFSQSESERRLLEKEWKDPYTQARCRLVQALNLRARERFGQALDQLEKIGTGDLIDVGLMSHALTHAAFIYCCLGRPDESRKALARAMEVNPDFRTAPQHLLPLHLAEGNASVAAKSLSNEYRHSKELIFLSAELGLKAGILYELAGQDDEGRAIFKDVSKRFPNEQVRYFGQLAKVLMEDSSSPIRMGGPQTQSEILPSITDMPYEHFRRSEMFFLIGLLNEKRGNKCEARALFELSVKEDPALRWPAFLAKRKTATIG